MTLSALGIFSAAGAGGVQGDYELIETVILASTSTSITFSSLATYASTYKHLQIRSTAKSSLSNLDLTSGNIRMRFNGDTGNNYAIHKLFGNGSTASSIASTSRSSTVGGLMYSNATANAFGAGVCDILDAYSTTKNKTTRLLASSFLGSSANTFIQLVSGVHLSTSAISSIELAPEDGGNIAIGSRFSLYGIRG
jgi:hypothetical protein